MAKKKKKQIFDVFECSICGYQEEQPRSGKKALKNNGLCPTCKKGSLDWVDSLEE